MPEKIEKPVEPVENRMREGIRGFNEVITTTTNFYFDTWGKMLRRSMEWTNQAERAYHEMFTTYTNMYQDGMKTWQEYMHDVNEIYNRTI